MRVLVVDDQPLARDRLVSLLSAEPDVDIVGTASTGREAVDAIQTHSPDLVFLDLQMPELDGFEVIDAVGLDRMPATVFVTAYDEFAIRAFEVHALDYLLKPFGRSRFAAAIQRARVHLERERTGALADRLAALLDDLKNPRAHGERLMVKSGGRVSFVPVEQIDWVEAEGNYTRLHVGAESYLQRETMLGIIKKLGEARFFRIHRSRIVNVERIKELRLAAGGDYEVILRTGERLPLSRLSREALQERLAKGG